MKSVLARFFARSDQPELLDFAGWPARLLRGNFRDIKRVNRFLGGVTLTLGHLTSLADQRPERQVLRLLDVGSGAGDLPKTWREWGERRGTSCRIVALDLSPAIARLARSENSGSPWLTAIAGDGLNLPFRNGSFDAANCALMLHHLSEDSAVKLLAELDRVTTLGFVINDLRRSLPGYVGAWLLAHLTTRNPLTRNDAPLSVRRAYTVDELVELGRRSGVANLSCKEEPWFRLSLVQLKCKSPARLPVNGLAGAR